MFVCVRVYVCVCVCVVVCVFVITACQNSPATGLSSVLCVCIVVMGWNVEDNLDLHQPARDSGYIRKQLLLPDVRHSITHQVTGHSSPHPIGDWTFIITSKQ